MMIRFLKIMAIVLAFGFAAQGCAIYFRDRGYFQDHRENWERHDRRDSHGHEGHGRFH